jgi:hypothetical protein
MNRRLAVSIAACLLLLVQFLLGMAVNVGAVLPPTTRAPPPATTSPA